MIGRRIIYAAMLVATASLGGLCFYILQPPEVGRLSETSQVIRSEAGRDYEPAINFKGVLAGKGVLIGIRSRFDKDPDCVRGSTILDTSWC